MATILVADDNSNIQRMVGLALKDQGIDVVAVGNGGAAVRKISDVRPDLVLADVFMPVRNGYEVCRYVKEDSSLAHIPVILLVGAFDPLDEQEAQRSGADGVLKKPFVPPDPLISMVKSALKRAGVPLGKESATGAKANGPDAASNVKDILTPGAGSQLAASSPAAVPEAEAGSVYDEFAAAPPQPPSVKIAAGSEPVAFSNLLETAATTDNPALVSEPIEELEQSRKRGRADSDEVEEAKEESPGEASERPLGLDNVLASPYVPIGGGKVNDWREEAFHGDSPANNASGHGWSPIGGAQSAELASVHSIEETDAPETAENEASSAAEPVTWGDSPESPWDLEAKQASLMAATWDAPTATDSASVAETGSVESVDPLPALDNSPAEALSAPVYASDTESDGNATQEAPVHTESVSSDASEPLNEEIAARASLLEVAFTEQEADTAVPASGVAEEARIAALPQPPQPDMDAMVARVLSNLSPEVLQKFTQEILKPAVAAIIKDELNAKK